MSLHDDERLLAAVAAALGETIALVRRRGFHIDSRLGGSKRQLAGSRFRPATDDSRLQRRARRLTGRRLRRRVA
jgi:hypothetical protein